MKSSKIIILSFCAFIILSTSTVFAKTLMTYNGTGIRGKYSVNSFNTKNGKFSVTHTNSSWNNVGSSYKRMQVQAHKKTWRGYSNQQTREVYGTGTKTLYYNVTSGTYKLYFHAPHRPAAANIRGSVNN